MTKLLCLSALSFFSIAAFAQGPSRSSKQHINGFRPANATSLPFSDAVLTGHTLYLSGRIGLDPKTGQAPADIDTELKLLMDGIGDILRKADAGWDDFVFVQVFCTDLSLYEKFNDAYKAKFKAEFPARAFVGVASILRGGHFEMTGIAEVHPSAKAKVATRKP